MESKMQERAPSPEITDAGVPAVAPKRAYRKPELVEYGNVRELTRGGGSKGQEPKTGQRRF